MSNTDTDPTDDLVQRRQPNQPPPQLNDLVQRSTDLAPQLNDLVQRNPPQPRTPSPALGDLDPSSQGKPPPQWPPQWRPNRQQHYVPSMANRSPGELGKPPVFPDLPNTWEVPGIYHGVARQLGQWGGSQSTRQVAQRLGQFTQSYTQGIHRGQRELARERYQQMTQAAQSLQAMLEREMTDYASVYNAFSSPDELHTEMMNRAAASGDMEMQAALNHSPQTAERLLQWRQAKLDDLHKSNRAQREYEEQLRARNPFMINPVGPDGTPTARLPKPFDTTPQRMTTDNIQLAGAFPTPSDPEEFGGRAYRPKSYPENDPSPNALEGAGGRLGEPQPLRPRPQWPDQPADPEDPRVNPPPIPQQIPPLDPNYRPGGKYDPDRQERGDEEGFPLEPGEGTDSDVERRDEEKRTPQENFDEMRKVTPPPPRPSLNPLGEDRPETIPTEPWRRRPWQRGPFDKASAPSLTQLAQADTGTATDAATLPQITVKPGEEDEEDQDGRTVWDDVRLREQIREARERGGTSGVPGAQPPSATGAQPPQPSPTGQPPSAAGGGRQGQPAGATTQAPDQTVPPQAATPAQTAPPAAGGQRPLTMTPALTAAQKQNMIPEEINNTAQRHFFGHMTATEFKSMSKPMQDAVRARESEMQGQLTGLLQGDLSGDDLLKEVEKISPTMAADMRATKAGVAAPPKKDPTGMFKTMMFKYDPSFTEQNYANRNKVMTAFITGPQSRNLLSANTFTFHANRLLHNLENAPNGLQEALYKGIPLAVLARMPEFTTMPGVARMMQEMEADRDALGSEFATALAQGGGGAGRGATGQERGEQAKKIDLNAPDAAIARVKELKVLVSGRVQALKREFEADTGMSFDAIKRKFDAPEMDEMLNADVRNQNQGGVIDFRDLK